MNYKCPLCKNVIYVVEDVALAICLNCRSNVIKGLSNVVIYSKNNKICAYSVWLNYSFNEEIKIYSSYRGGVFISPHEGASIKISDHPILLEDFNIKDFSKEKLKLMFAFS